MPTSTPRRSLRSQILGGGAFLLALALAGPALGHGALMEPAPTPPAPPGDGRKAEQVAGAVEKDVGARGERAEWARGVVRDALDRVKKVLDRARGAEVSGDAAHGRMLSALALEWAEIARDLLRAADAERGARDLESKLKEERAQTDRARALLAETQARLERVRGELARAEEEAKEAKAKAAAAEEERLKGKGPKGGKAPKKGGGR